MGLKLVKKIVIIIGILIVLSIIVGIVRDNTKNKEAKRVMRELCNSPNLDNPKAIEWFNDKSIDEVPILIELLNDKGNRVRINAAYFLGVAKDSRAVIPLYNLLNDDNNWRARFFAAQALGEIGDKRAVDNLSKAWQRECLNSGPNVWTVQQEIAKALIKIRDEEIATTFYETYKSNNKDVHLLSAIALYMLKKKEEYLNDIKNVIDSGNKVTLGRVVFVLGDIGDQRFVPILQEIKEKYSEISQLTQKAIEKIESRSE